MNRNIVRTIPEKCKQCYSCVRNCPVKAVKIQNGQAEVLQDRCIYCGNCVKMCSQNAKQILSGMDYVRDFLESNEYTVAMLAPSYPASFNCEKGKIVSALRKLGFAQVWEVAVGAELVAQEYQKFNYGHGSIISSTCPAIVNLIQKHHPEFIPYMAPVMSPAQATAKLIKDGSKGKSIKTVFIGPCIAKKAEMDEPGLANLIDQVLTFDECKQLFQENRVDLNQQEVSEFDSPPASLSYLLPLPGGLLKNINVSNDILVENYAEVNGINECLDIIDTVKDGKVKFVDCLFCTGCISGPKIDDAGSSYVNKKSEIINRLREVPIEAQAESKAKLLKRGIDLSRSFYDLSSKLSAPEEDEINRILKETGKEKAEDLLNCGACGYSSCREKAIAVYQGIAENEMCLPYLLAQKNFLLDSLKERLDKETQLSEELESIIQSSYDGICVTDENGVILRVNNSFEKMLDMDKTKIIGNSAQQLEEEGVLTPSISLLVIKSKKPVTVIQTINGGKKVLATGSPVFDSNGKLSRIIVNTRDMQQFQELRTQIEQIMYRNDKGNQIKNGKKINIIAHSREFNQVLDIVSRVSKVDTTILILGESGVGKEVVAGYIHNHSRRKEKPLIKINCTTIPETLLESELFGYDSGAFTGAKKQGKKGLLELADGGTVFLDEIGELPMSQQVKLLRVLQERQITRIGGIKPVDIDIRIITATNKNLADMVREGRFRADLYYRLNVVPVNIPPLRNRRDDIIPLTYFFLDLYNKKYYKNKTMFEDVKELLLTYNWPGNVRELQNIVERLVVTTENEIIDKKDLTYFIKDQDNMEYAHISVNGIIPLKKALEEVEKQLIEKSRALYDSTYKIAEVLEVNQSTIVRKINKYLKEE